MATAPIIEVSDDPVRDASVPKLVIVADNGVVPARRPLVERFTIGLAGVVALVVVMLNVKWIAEAYS